jgi:hypothetical protein
MFGLIERLLRSATDLVFDVPLHDLVVVRYANDLAFGEASIFTPEAKPLSFGHRVVMVGFGPFTAGDNDQVGLDVDGVELVLVTPAQHIAEVGFDWVDAHVEVHDLIPMHSGGGWMPPALIRWFDALVAGHSSELVVGPEHWWVGEVDVADALVRLLISEQPFPELSKMSGRRSWGEATNPRRIPNVVSTHFSRPKRLIRDRRADSSPNAKNRVATPHGFRFAPTYR